MAAIDNGFSQSLRGRVVDFDWREFLSLAKFLQSSRAHSVSLEAADRSAVSRAYYAAFCYIRNHAETNFGFRREKKGADHWRLREHLGRQGPIWKEIADKLGDLHEWRKHCDYEDAVPNLEIMVLEAISTAEDVIDRLQGNNYAR